MNCNCRVDLEAKLTENFKSKTPEGVDHKSSLGGYGYVMTSNGVEDRGCMEVTSTAKFKQKSGALKEKKTKQSMFFSYCPFCGKKAVKSV